MKKMLISALVFLFLVAGGVLCASAAGGSGAAFSVSDTGYGTKPVSSVDVYFYSSKNGYLFLPAELSSEKLQLWYSSEETATIDGEEVLNGGETEAFSEGAVVSVVIGRNSYSVTVCKSANIPSVYITTESGSMRGIDSSKNHSEEETGNMVIVNADGTVEYDGSLAQIRGRGNASWQNGEKKPYQIKLGTKTNLFEMGKAKTWCLLSNNYDYSCLRNDAIFNLAESCGLDYTPQGEAVDLYTNGEYRGTYLLTTKIQIDSKRVDITDLEKANEQCNELPPEEYALAGSQNSSSPGTYQYCSIPNNPEDITGGYLLEVDIGSRYIAESSGFVTNAGICVVIKEPECASKAEVEYIRQYVQEMENALLSGSGYNGRGRHYSEYMDVDSFAYRLLVEEFSCNADAGKTSFYMYKDSDLSGDGLLHFGPVWDYDISLGNYYTDKSYSDPSKWVCFAEKTNNIWFSGITGKSDFVSKLCEIYHNGFRECLLNMEEYVASEAEHISDSVEMNYLRYPNELAENSKVGETYEQELAFLQSFLKSRIEIFDICIGSRTIATDVKLGDWYASFVSYVMNMGVMNGTSAKAFSPNATMTRAMFVTTLYNYEGDSASYGKSSFSDVKEADYYYDAVNWASANGIASGMSRTEFDPNGRITREQMCTMLCSYLRYKGISTTTSVSTAFSDDGSISLWAREAVYFCRDMGIVSGVGGNSFSPGSTATRAQTAAVIYNASACLN